MITRSEKKLLVECFKQLMIAESALRSAKSHLASVFAMNKASETESLTLSTLELKPPPSRAIKVKPQNLGR